MICLPFRGIRPAEGKIEKVNVPPYDVVSREEAENFAKDNPDSFFHVTRADIDRPELDEHDPKVYEEARKNLEKLMASGTLVRDHKKHYYLYRQNWRGTSRTGVFAVMSVDEYNSGKIKKHELTRPDKENDRTTLLMTVKANTGPVFLLFKDSPGFDDITANIMKEKPLYIFTDENGVENIVWKTNETANTALKEYFEKIDNFYIADGHHRGASAARTCEYLRSKNPKHNGNEAYNYFLAVVFPASSLQIIPYNRAVLNLNGMDSTTFVDKISKSFEITKTDIDKPARKGEIILMLPDGNLLLKPKSGIVDASNIVESLDVAVLQKLIFEPILDIHDIRTSKNINFVGGINSTNVLKKMLNNGRAAAAFSLFPVDISDLINVADENKIMPPKSTWFEPKLRSGVLVHSLKE